ncbi:GNAT family N-acetyltransferase [Streptomyces sp. NPDC058430]|uniref:GNAT family N-acetyltransferase n=1 Tax=Streptomyces sp. NPDC058430 TaxID=3346495 RepID=UPI0036529E36
MDGLREPVTATDISSQRLELLPLQVKFADEMAAVLGDPALHTFIGGAPLPARELRERYGRLVTGSPDPAVSWCNWVLRIRDEECLAGTVQATVGPGDDGLEAEIAWVVGVPWQGRGLATEAALALVDRLGRQSVRTVVAHIHPDHAASAAVATACGLTPTDRMHDGEVRWRRTLG